MSKVLAYTKAIVAVVIPLGATAVAAIGNADVTNWWLAITAVLTALGVWAAPNKA